MADSAFACARTKGGSSLEVVLVHLLGIAAAVLVPLLILDLGFLVELMVQKSLQGEWLPWAGPLLASLAEAIRPVKGDETVWLLLLVLPGLLLAALLALVLWLYYGAVHAAALGTATQLRLAVQKQAFRLGSSDLLGSLTSRPEELFGDQIERVRTALTAWWLAVPRSYVALALLSLLALWVNATITIVALVLGALTYLFYRWLAHRGAAAERVWQDRARQQLLMLLERLRLAPLVAGYALPQPPGERFEEDLARHAAAEAEAKNSLGAIFPLTLLFVLAGSSLLLVLIGNQMLTGQFSLPGAIVLGTTLLAAYFPWQRAMRLADDIADAEQPAEEVFTYLDREPAIHEAPGATPLGKLRGLIALESVKLADRQGTALLDGASAAFPAKQRIALLATDPQVPMALAGLLVRLYDPAAGRVVYDGREITSATLASLRGECLFVGGDGSLFTGSVQDNITCGDARFSPAQATEAAKLARAYDFVQHLPQGFATLVGPHALTLDASQAFRIGLARALVRGPSLVVVAEPEGPLDLASAEEIDAALKKVTDTATLIILPRHIDTIRGADRVYLFHDGKLHGEGTHTELIEASELYRHVIYLRFNALRDQVRA